MHTAAVAREASARGVLRREGARTRTLFLVSIQSRSGDACKRTQKCQNPTALLLICPLAASWSDSNSLSIATHELACVARTQRDTGCAPSLVGCFFLVHSGWVILLVHFYWYIFFFYKTQMTCSTNLQNFFLRRVSYKQGVCERISSIRNL